MIARHSWLLIISALLATTCLKRQEPPPFVDPGQPGHRSDQVGDDIDYGEPSRTNGESAGGYTGGGSIGGGAGVGGSTAGQSIDDIEGGTGTSGAAVSSFTGTTGTGTVQLVRNDIVKGREQALAAALKDALLKKAQADGISVPADMMAKFRKYVTRYKIIGEGATDEGTYKLDLEADVDTSSLRADIGARVGGGPTGVMLELHVENVRRARDLRAIAGVLRADRRITEVRQQSYARNRAVLEVDTIALAADVAELVGTTQCEDGVTVVIDKVTDKSVKATIVFPKG